MDEESLGIRKFRGIWEVEECRGETIYGRKEGGIFPFEKSANRGVRSTRSVWKELRGRGWGK